MNETNASMCIYICICIFRFSYNRQADEWQNTDACLRTQKKRDGDSAGSTRAFCGAESASRKPAQNGYGEDRGEELGSSPATLRPPQNAIPLQYLSLSFIAQGGRSLPPHYITFIPYPFGQGYALIFSQMNACF